MRTPDIDKIASIDYQKALVFQGDMIDFFTGGKLLTQDRYLEMREQLLASDELKHLTPAWLRTCRDLPALWSFAKSVHSSWEPRREFLRQEFEPLLNFLESRKLQTESDIAGSNEYNASAWTGVSSISERVKAVRTLIPLAKETVACLIRHLELPNHNGAPPLEDALAAIEYLKKLHSALGQFLAMVEEDNLSLAVDSGLMSDMAKYARRAARALKDDPLPYALSGTLLAIFTACGFPNLGGYLGSVALTIKKSN